MRKKMEGINEMVSYFVDEEHGLGLRLIDDQLQQVNASRRILSYCSQKKWKIHVHL